MTADDYVVGVSGGQIGNLEAGALGSLTSPTVSALAGGLITVAGSIVIGLALPAFARYRFGRQTSETTTERHAHMGHPDPTPVMSDEEREPSVSLGGESSGGR